MDEQHKARGQSSQQAQSENTGQRQPAPGVFGREFAIEAVQEDQISDIDADGSIDDLKPIYPLKVLLKEWSERAEKAASRLFPPALNAW